ncbi:hypothetical protein LZ32DRAFT_196377 [Colletotrichum eremochloae]|nr:hypothetical protein LZ32DRAFT_196377 [Colletotrichum eremochloae]
MRRDPGHKGDTKARPKGPLVSFCPSHQYLFFTHFARGTHRHLRSVVLFWVY